MGCGEVWPVARCFYFVKYDDCKILLPLRGKCIPPIEQSEVEYNTSPSGARLEYVVFVFPL